MDEKLKDNYQQVKEVCLKYAKEEDKLKTVDKSLPAKERAKDYEHNHDILVNLQLIQNGLDELKAEAIKLLSE